MSATHIVRAVRHRYRSVWPTTMLRATATLLLMLSNSWSGAQGQRSQKSAFPQACTRLLAQMRSTPNGPEDELRFDTQRIQDVLDRCPAGEAVELEGADRDHQRQNAFLVAPLRIPAGVTLLIDAGVTVFASRRPEDFRQPGAILSPSGPCGDLPCRSLIAAGGAAGSFAASVSGFGTLDGRGSAPLFDLGGSDLSWASFPAAQRPHLIDATGSFELHKLTLRDAPATGLDLSGRGVVTVERAKFLGSTATAEAHGIVVASPYVRLAVADSTFAQQSSAIADATQTQLAVENTSIHSGTAFNNASVAGASSRCIASTAPAPACTPANLPLYAGEVFLSDSRATNLIESTPGFDLSIHAVVSATEPGLPSPSGSITFYDGSRSVGTASLVDGMATLRLPSLDPTRSHLITARDDFGIVSFGSGRAMVQTNLTNLALSSNATHAAYNTPVDLTASATPSTATGGVSFYDGATLLGQLPLTAGSVVLTATQLTPGIHALTAHYAGDSNNAAADSPPLNLRIDQAQPSLSFSALPATAVYGTLNHVTVNVAPSSASGSVALIDSYTTNGQTTHLAVGSATLTGGTASLPLANPAVGNHVFTATYSGDTNNLPASVATNLTISALPTTLSLAAPQSTQPYGSTASFVASVTPSSATGNITFRDSVAGLVGQTAIANGISSLNLTTLSPGTHSISAAYSGDATHSASVSPSSTLTVTPTPSTVALTPLPSTLSAGLPLALTASVQPGSASGVVTFSTTSGSTLGQSQITHGSAALTISSLQPGSYVILASYGGDTFNGSSTSLGQPTRITGGSSITLDVSATSATYGSPITLSANVTPASATGSVTFSDTQQGTLGTVPLNAGTASLTISNLAAGNHALQATYSGDGSHSSATSASTRFAIVQAATQITLTLAQTSVPAGSSIAINVRVAAQASVLPTGTVQIQTGSRILASAQILNSLPGSGYVTLLVSSSTLGVGSFPVSAFYGGDSNNAGSSSSSNPTVTILATPTTCALKLSSGQIARNAPVALSVQLAAANAADAPTGSVDFLDNGVAFASAPVNATGAASITFTPARLGSHSLSAIYQPTGSFAGSSTTMVPLTVTLPLALTLSPQALDAAPNSTHTVKLTITPLSGYTGAPRAICITPASFITCTVNAPSLVGGSPVQSNVSITIARDLSGQASIERPLTAKGSIAFASLLPICLLFRRRSFRPKTIRAGMRSFGLTLIALLLTSSLTGCALGGNFFTIPTGPQSVAIDVTAAGTTVTSALTVNITP